VKIGEKIMTRNVIFFVLHLVALMILNSEVSVYGDDPHYQSESNMVGKAFGDNIDHNLNWCFSCRWFHECLCEYRPSEPYQKAEIDEYNKRKNSAVKSLIGDIDGIIAVEGKREDFDLKNRNLDFATIQGIFASEYMSETKIVECSFFAANFGKSRFLNDIF
jgi:hypothetical protein